MQILAILAIGFIIVLVIALFIGSLDNARPVSTWSDDKLQRMHRKLLNASSAEGNREKSAQHFKKAQEVKQEIEKRKLQRAEQFAAGLADQMAPSIQEATQKMQEAVQRIVQEEKVSFEEAHKIVADRLSETTKKFLAQGMTEDQAMAASMKEILNMNI